jgi:acid phosphatase family membrane protein YuiD
MTKMILSIVATWVFVNILKPIIKWIKAGRFEKRFLLEEGGMPSGHTSWVAPLTTALYMETGFSHYFMISLVLTMNVVYDAVQVRPKLGKLARALNRMNERQEGFVKLEENIGHTLPEVLVSLVLSVLIPVAIYRML